jgi:hypothetical protein
MEGCSEYGVPSIHCVNLSSREHIMAPHSYFKDLDIDLLKTFAKEWVDHFKEINIDRIELRRYSKLLKFAGYSGEIKTIYAIVFFTLEQKEDLFEEVADGVQGPPYKQFVAKTQYLETRLPKRYAAFVGADFKKVYRSGSFVGDNYLDEWIFIPLAKDEALPLHVDNKTPPVVLYQDTILRTKEKKRKRRYEEVRNAVRIASENLFKKYPGFKTTEVMRHKEIHNILNIHGYNLKEKTLREWIQDLNPNYRPKGSNNH